MKLSTLVALCALTFTHFQLASSANSQQDKVHDKQKPAPVIIKFNAHSMHAGDFQARRSKDRGLELKIKQQGIDAAFTEWMQRDHPFIFAKECVKQVGEIAIHFKSTNHMIDFDKQLTKHPDLRLSAEKYGHDIAFAEWLRAEHPDVYRAHFNIKAPKKPDTKGDHSAMKHK